MWPKLPFILPQASSYAARVDWVMGAITLVGLFFATVVAATIIFFAVKYRQGSRVNRTLPGHEGIALELTWTMIPLVIAIGLYIWSTSVYYSMVRVPRGAMDVYVVGKQWMWKMQHSTGRWEMNELHVPVGRPIKLTMISEDVIHDFGIPSMRVKQDVLPGRYTETWFEPTRVGRYHIFCSQFCGTNHAIMGGYVTVMEPADFEKWMATGNVNTSLASAGERKFRELGCTGCHGANASVRAPNLEGIYNQSVPVQLADEGMRTTVVKADDRYLHDSILLPEKEIAAGYQPIMPSFKGRVTEEELVQIIDYIKSLSTSNGTSNGLGRSYSSDNSGNSVSGTSSAGLGTANVGGSGGGMGDAGTGYGIGHGNPTGDMSNIVDREGLYGSTGGDALSGETLARRSPTGDMSNIIDRETQYRSGTTVGGNADALVDSSAGSLNNGVGRRQPLKTYTTDNYTRDAARVFTGGLQPTPVGGGAAGKGGQSANPANRGNARKPVVAPRAVRGSVPRPTTANQLPRNERTAR
jgi:cytochrome c oxidase subunit 2